MTSLKLNNYNENIFKKQEKDLSNLSDAGMDVIRACTDGLYTPVDLTVKFADEIAQYGGAKRRNYNRRATYRILHLSMVCKLVFTAF